MHACACPVWAWGPREHRKPTLPPGRGGVLEGAPQARPYAHVDHRPPHLLISVVQIKKLRLQAVKYLQPVKRLRQDSNTGGWIPDPGFSHCNGRCQQRRVNLHTFSMIFEEGDFVFGDIPLTKATEPDSN